LSQKTLLHDLHVRLQARIVDFHGWLLPVQYEGIIAEHRCCRKAACLFDTSHMGQFLLTGPKAADDLAGLLTRDARKMRIGQCRLALLLNEQASILDDSVLLRLAPEEFMLCVNAGPRHSDLEWISSRLSADTVIVDQTEKWGKIDFQGPMTYSILAPHVEDDLSSLRFYTGFRTRCMGKPAIITRSGYTGELGYEICASGDDLIQIAQTLLEHPDVKPAGLGARDLLRLEMGYNLSGQDIGEFVNPIEADMERLMCDTHEFVGSAALDEIKRHGASRRLVALTCDTRRKMSTHDQILHKGEVVGEVTSGAYSPSIEASIGLGYVKLGLWDEGTILTVRTQRADMDVTVASKPMYKNGTCRTNIQEAVK
jgi:aminomethyltransferase